MIHSFFSQKCNIPPLFFSAGWHKLICPCDKHTSDKMPQHIGSSYALCIILNRHPDAQYLALRLFFIAGHILL